ncbi:MAG: hypothetical protein KDD25_02815 [Bdellovibrionales bacterium]|nr:hypothetical protein [Bdellovibrionales bacterium]
MLNLKLGQKVWATVEESISESGLIVNFNGDLVRVENQSHRTFRPGQRIQLDVYSIGPTKFRLVETKRFNLGRLNFDV